MMIKEQIKINYFIIKVTNNLFKIDEEKRNFILINNNRIKSSYFAYQRNLKEESSVKAARDYLDKLTEKG